MKLLQQLMDEAVEMPGFPQVIVRRGWLYAWLKDAGWDKSERGFGSLDYTVFARQAVPQSELTPDTERDYWLNRVREEYLR